MHKWSGARVALVGLGPIGVEVGKALAGRPGIEFLGAADPAPAVEGKSLAEVLGTPAAPAIKVDADAAALYARSAKDRQKRDVVLLCTGSRLDNVVSQIEQALDAGFHVVSSCEELSYPEL